MPKTRNTTPTHRGCRRKSGPNTRVPPTQPAHSLVVFLPLCDLNETNGPTSFLPGSHQRWTSDALEAEADAPGSSSAGAPAILDVDAGDAVIFDSRTQHAGGANRSQRARPILYLVFARPWFDEAMHRRLVGGAGGGDGVERLFPEFSASGGRVILFCNVLRNLRTWF